MDTISLTGILWLFGTSMSWTLGYKMLKGALKRDNLFLYRFGFFFVLLGLGVGILGVALFTSDSASLKAAMVVGQGLVWVAYIVLAEATWFIYLQKRISRWVFPSVMAVLGVVTLVLLVQSSTTPEVLQVGSRFSVVRWNISTLPFLLFLAGLWSGTIPVGFYFAKRAVDIGAMKTKLRSYTMAGGFVITPTAGVFSIINQPVEWILFETLFALIGFTSGFISALITPTPQQQNSEIQNNIEE